MLHLDFPSRTTKEYKEPVIAPKVAAALEDALREEDEIQVDAAGLYANLSASPGLGGICKKPKSGWEPLPLSSCALSSPCFCLCCVINFVKFSVKIFFFIIVFFCPILNSLFHSRPKTGKKVNTPTSAPSPSGSGSPLYPKSRGLVPKWHLPHP